jgi:pilus assembly protein Flp/PilA
MFKVAPMTIGRLARRFARDEAAATAVEYAIVASGIAVAIAATVMSLGSSVNGLYTSVSTHLN